jgi:hypothetical protein
MTKYRALLPIVIAITSIYFTACEEVKNPCLLPKTAPVGIGFYRTVESDTGMYIKDSVLPSPIMAALDSPYAFVFATPASKYKILLSPIVDSTKIFIAPDTLNRTPSGRDTVVFYYTRKLHFLSTACGYTHFFSLLEVKTTNHLIDSARIVKSEITNTADVEHVKIYY